MTLRRLVWSLAVLTFSVGLSQANAQTYYRWTIGVHVGQQLRAAADGAFQAAENKAMMAAELREARQAYWSTFPDGAGIDEAAERYRVALEQKDFYLAMIDAIDGSGTAAMLDAFLGGPLDGGVPQRAERAFRTWVGAIRSASGYQSRPFGSTNQQVVFVNPLVLDNPGVRAAYERYVVLRDLAELYRGPAGPFRPGASDLEVLTGLLVFWDQGDEEEARLATSLMSDVLGPQQLRVLAGNVRSQRNDPPHPVDILMEPVRAAMISSRDTERFRAGSYVLEGLERDLQRSQYDYTTQVLSSRLGEYYSPQELTLYTQQLMTREEPGKLICGESSCYGRLLTSIDMQDMAPAVAMANAIESIDELKTSLSRALTFEGAFDNPTNRALGANAVDPHENPVLTTQQLLQNWMNELYFIRRITPQVDYREVLTLLMPARIAGTPLQSPLQAWQASLALARLEVGCLDEPDPDVREAICQAHEAIADDYRRVVDLYRWTTPNPDDLGDNQPQRMRNASAVVPWTRHLRGVRGLTESAQQVFWRNREEEVRCALRAGCGPSASAEARRVLRELAAGMVHRGYQVIEHMCADDMRIEVEAREADWECNRAILQRDDWLERTAPYVPSANE